MIIPPCRPTIQRLLIPVKNRDDGAPAVTYAIRRRAQGVPVAVCLLHVEEPAAPARGNEVFARASQLLRGLDIEVATQIRSGPVVFSIFDAAEELECSEIVVAAPGPVVFHPWSRRLVAALLAGQQGISVVTVGRDGIDRPGKHLSQAGMPHGT